VIGIIGTLSAIALYFINPSVQLNKAEDVERLQNASELQKAMVQRMIDTGEFINDSQIPTQLELAMPICSYQVTTDVTCINVDGLVSGYIATLSRDQVETNANYSGYAIYKHDGFVAVISTHLGE